MTVSEIKFRNYYKKLYSDAFIFKIPDFKMTGCLRGGGLPDYLTIINGRTVWCEVKTCSGRSLYIKDFTIAQHRVFYKMLLCGAVIHVYVLVKNFFVILELSVVVWNGFLRDKKISVVR